MGARTIRWSFITLVIGSALDATVPSNTSKPIAPRRLLFALLRINILLGTSSVLLDVFQNTVLARPLGGDEISIREFHIRFAKLILGKRIKNMIALNMMRAPILTRQEFSHRRGLNS